MRRWGRRLVLGVGGLVVVLTVASLLYNAFTGPASVPPGLRYVQAGDVRTRIRAWGEGTGGVPVVLVHGFVENADTWAPTGEALGRTHPTYALDLVGFGYSQRVGPFDLDHQARQTLALVRALGLTRPVLVGHSSGAAIAARAALLAPGEIGGLMFLDGDALATGAGARSPVRFLLVKPYRTTLLRLALGVDGIIRSVLDSRCGPACPRADAATLDRWRRPLEVPGADDALFEMVGRGAPGLPIPDLERLRGLPFPKSVVFGAHDDVFTPGTPAETAARIGAPAPTLLPDGRHLTQVSDGPAVAAAVDAMLAR